MKVIAGALAFLALAAGVTAKPLISGKLGVSLDVPEGWTDSPEMARSVRPPAELIAGLVDQDAQRTFTALSIALKPGEALGYVPGLLGSLKKQGFTVGENVPRVINGVSYESYTATAAAATAPVMQVFSTFANSRAFTLSITSQAGDPAKDAELQALVQSFRFLSPPQAMPSAPDARRIGYEVGRVIGMVACPAIFLLGAGAIFGGGYFIFRKKK